MGSICSISSASRYACGNQLLESLVVEGFLAKARFDDLAGHLTLPKAGHTYLLCHLAIGALQGGVDLLRIHLDRRARPCCSLIVQQLLCIPRLILPEYPS